MIEGYAAALYSSGILDQAASVLEQRLAGDALNLNALNTLGEIYRKQGRLSDAASVYERITASAPQDERAAYLHALLSGQVPPKWKPNDLLQPAPFAFIRDFLPPELHRTLLPRVLDTPEEAIVASTVGNNDYKPDIRVSFTVKGLREIQDAFWALMAAALPSILPKLQVEPFAIGRTEVRVRTYRADNFFEVHRDNSLPESSSRRASFVYFFHRVPRRYSGGDLLLFDTNTGTNRYAITSFTRIVPVDNAVVIIPSHFYHAVVPVQCASPDPGDTRFVINGHVHVRRDGE